jgi:hypothetical protein
MCVADKETTHTVKLINTTLALTDRQGLGHLGGVRQILPSLQAVALIDYLFPCYNL